jgi:hypothetical protein
MSRTAATVWLVWRDLNQAEFPDKKTQETL